MLTEPDAVVERREIARRVGNARIVAGLSRADLARAAGVEPRRLEQLETGRGAPSEAELRSIAAACGLEYGDLIPNGYHLTLAVGGAVLAAGRSTSDQERDTLLREYVKTVFELRRSPVKLATIRHEDVVELARVLGTTPEEIQARLQQLVAAGA
jgi:transcriptional regulator with XRE-family HTH domain